MLGGCVYYNGVYNARAATARADELARQGFPDSARVFWQRGSEAAEAVLQKTAESQWHAEMLLHAGRSAAMLSECDRAEKRLSAFFLRSDADTSRSRATERVLATLALGACDMRRGNYDLVESRLAPLATSGAMTDDPELLVTVARLRAEAALASGALTRADSLLRLLPVEEARWERLAVAASRNDWAAAEPLMLDRALMGDARPEIDAILRRAMTAGQTTLVLRVVDAFDAGNTPRRDRARLQLLVGELLEYVRDTAAARALYQRVSERTAVDSLARAEAAARLSLLDLAGVDSIASLRLWLARAFTNENGSAQSASLDRAQSVCTLLLMLYDTDDASGAAMFLAGEVARDSLQHEQLAAESWRTLTTRWPDAPLAARALVMAARVRPDSAAVWQREVNTRYASSAMAAWLRGESIVDAADYRTADALLAGRWALAINALPDTLRVRRAAAPLPGQSPDQ